MPVDYTGPYSPEYYNNDDSYHPWWYDWGIEAIRRGAETAQVASAGYPEIPHPYSVPQPAPYPTPTGTQSQSQHVNIPTNLLIWGGIFAAFFFLGKGRR